MLNKIIIFIKNLDTRIKIIMKNGFIFSFLFCILSILILYIYHKLNTYPMLFSIGAILFKTSLTFFMDFIICGVAFDKIIKEWTLRLILRFIPLAVFFGSTDILLNPCFRTLRFLQVASYREILSCNKYHFSLYCFKVDFVSYPSKKW